MNYNILVVDDGKELQLTPIEFSILWYLCERQGIVVPSEELFEAVWGERFLQNNNPVMHISDGCGRRWTSLQNPLLISIKNVWAQL